MIEILISSPESVSPCSSITSLSKKRIKKRPLGRPYIELCLTFSPLPHHKLQNIGINEVNSRFWKIRQINQAAKIWSSFLKVRHSRRRILHNYIHWIIDRSFQVSQAKSFKISTQHLNIKQNPRTNNAHRKLSSHLLVKSSNLNSKNSNLAKMSRNWWEISNYSKVDRLEKSQRQPRQPNHYLIRAVVILSLTQNQLSLNLRLLPLNSVMGNSAPWSETITHWWWMKREPWHRSNMVPLCLLFVCRNSFSMWIRWKKRLILRQYRSRLTIKKLVPL